LSCNIISLGNNHSFMEVNRNTRIEESWYSQNSFVNCFAVDVQSALIAYFLCIWFILTAIFFNWRILLR
jgi:hypothetical protein